MLRLKQSVRKIIDQRMQVMEITSVNPMQKILLKKYIKLCMNANLIFILQYRLLIYFENSVSEFGTLFFYINLSRPEITIHKKRIVMKEETNYVKRTQRDYTLTFKLNVVREVEAGEISTTGACRKYGIQSRSTVV